MTEIFLSNTICNNFKEFDRIKITLNLSGHFKDVALSHDALRNDLEKGFEKGFER